MTEIMYLARAAAANYVKSYTRQWINKRILHFQACRNIASSKWHKNTESVVNNTSNNMK